MNLKILVLNGNFLRNIYYKSFKKGRILKLFYIYFKIECIFKICFKKIFRF